MTTLIEVLKNSLIVLKKEPKLFLPKIFLSLLWGLMLLYSANLLVQLQKINLMDSPETKTVLLNELLPGTLLLLFFSFVFFIIDSVINSAYPLMIQKYLNKQSFSIWNSIKLVLTNFWKIIIPIFLAFLLSMIILLPFTLLFSFFFVQQNYFIVLVLALIILLLVFFTTVLFYFIYPVSSIEKKGLSSVINTIKKSRKNLKEASFGSFIALVLSLISALIVSFSETKELIFFALIIFLVLRIITAVLATYSMVLNPLLYFKK